MPIYDEPGRGRKQCLNCMAYGHARQLTCEKCNSVFTKTEKVNFNVNSVYIESHAESTPEVVSRARTTNKIIAPAGACPLKLSSTDKQDVENWKKQLQSSNSRLSDEAIEYWVREFYRFESEDYEKIISILRGQELESV